MKEPEGIMKSTGMYEIHTKGHECVAIRENCNEIRIHTGRRLNDDQMKDLFLIAYGMALTGGTLKDIIEVSAEQIKDGD